MENKKQTAVDWVLEYLWKNHHLSFSDSNLMKAKAMEKEQIIEAYVECWKDIMPDQYGGTPSARDYYTSTYGQ